MVLADKARVEEEGVQVLQIISHRVPGGGGGGTGERMGGEGGEGRRGEVGRRSSSVDEKVASGLLCSNK